MRFPSLSAAVYLSFSLCLTAIPAAKALADPCTFDDAEEQSQELASPLVQQLTVNVKRSERGWDLFCLEVTAHWSVNDRAFSQVLRRGEYLALLRVDADPDGLILVSAGGRYAPEGYGSLVRFRYDDGNHQFYEAEKWERDDWDPYIAQLEEYLAKGAFSQAKQLVKRRGTSPNGGHSVLDSEFFIRFAKATHREAMRAWRAGRKEAAGRLVYDLLDTTPILKTRAGNGETTYVLGLADKEAGDKPVKGYPIPAEARNHELVNNLAFFLSESKYAAHAVGILEQVVIFAPEREVAWLNLGDAYSKTGNGDKAAEAYTRYRKLMKEKGRDSSIPARVIRALK